MANHTIRRMNPDDIDFAISQTSREGWGVPRESFELCLAHDPDGAFIMQCGQESIGMVTATCYLETAWIGHLIVVPQHRYQGLGAALMDHVIQHIKSKNIENILLDADPPGVKLYKRLGFSHVTDSLRYAGQVHISSLDNRPQRIQTEDIPGIVEFDSQHFGDDRRRMLPLLLQHATAAYVIKEEQNISGYGLSWSQESSVRLGPIVAKDQTIANLIVAAITQSFDDATTFAVGVPATNTEAVMLYESFRMKQTPASFRMMLSANVRSPSDKIYAIASGAFG